MNAPSRLEAAVVTLALVGTLSLAGAVGWAWGFIVGLTAVAL